MDTHADRIKPDSFGITTYLENLRRGHYQIPTFQREVVWNRDRVKRLWDSISRFYPLGSILVWKTETRLQNHRAIGGHVLDDPPQEREYQYLLDGQQRTTALLTSMYGGKVEGDGDRDPHLYVNLSVEDSDEVEDQSWRERFLFWDEIDDRGGELLRNVGRKQQCDAGMVVRLEDIAHRYGDLERRLEEAGHGGYDDPARRELRRFKRVFDSYKLSFIELRGIEVAEVCQIFERINQAGQPLSMFDIVVAKTFRPETDGFAGFYLRGILADFRQDLGDAGSPYVGVDDMTLLQILAVLVRDSDPSAGVHNITDRYLNVIRTEHIEKVWEDAQPAIRRIFDFLHNHLRLPGPALVPYRYFYMSLASYFFRNKEPDYDLLRSYFWFHSFHNEDLISNTTHLREHVRKFKEARAGAGFGFQRFLIDRNRLRKVTYSSRGRLSRAVLALFANQDPCDWALPDRSVLTAVYYTLSDRPNLHHIFPKAFCEKNLGEDGRYADSLMNIAYLTRITNAKISDRNPLEYVTEFLTPRYGEVERKHLLPTVLSEWARSEEAPKGALATFVNERIDLVLEKLRSYLPGITFDVIDTRFEEDAGEDQQPLEEGE